MVERLRGVSGNDDEDKATAPTRMIVRERLSVDQVSQIRRSVSDVEQAVTAEIIPRLLMAHRARSEGEASRMDVPGICEDERHRFLRLILTAQPDDAELFLDGLAERGISNHDLLLDLMAGTARRLGELWDRDDADFTEVTLGLCTLHRLVRERDWCGGTRPCLSGEAPRVLLATFSGEQHLFGVSIVSEFFRQAGWAVSVTAGAPNTVVIESLAADWYDVLGLSSAYGHTVESAAAEIAAMRAGSKNPDIKVIVGGHAFDREPDLAARIGADAWADDAGAAPAIAARLHRSVNARI